MATLKETLLEIEYFHDNEYLDMYCRLIESNKRTPQRGGLTNKHHIIPRSCFKLLNKPVDDSLSNLVNLVYRNHVMAHYYLCLCTSGPLQYANELALICLATRKQLSIYDKQLVTQLPLYNKIYEDYTEKRQQNYQLYEDIVE